MPCSKCNADFNFVNWKFKCYECEDNYCSKCLRKVEGEMHCESCEILIKRPPIRGKLMELKPKDLQQYLNKHNISTYGVVEKQELVELFYRHQIPPRQKKSRKFANALSGSVPNLAARSQTVFNNLRSNAEAAFNSRNFTNGHSANSSPHRSPVSPTQTQPTVNIINSHPTTSSSTTQHSDLRFGSVFRYLRHNMRNTSNPHTQLNVNATIGVPSESPQQPKKYPKLSDFEAAEDLNDLTVKQLKELLTLNRVDYKGCVEKAELLERANRLWADANIRKINEESADVEECCKICMDAPLDCVLLECGHIATCIDCGKRLAECPICRQYVTRVVRTFKA